MCAPSRFPCTLCRFILDTFLPPHRPIFTNPSPCSLWVNCQTSKPSCAVTTLKRMPWPNSTCPLDLYRLDRVQIPSASRAHPTSALAKFRLRHITLSDSAGFARRWRRQQQLQQQTNTPHHSPCLPETPSISIASMGMRKCRICAHRRPLTPTTSSPTRGIGT